MKNQFLLFLCLIFSASCLGQQKYLFDYLIEYDFQFLETHKTQKMLFLTNSKDNSYFIQVSEKDSLTYNVYFLDSKGIISTTYINKNDFQTAEMITLKCDFVSHFINPFKYQVENYHFENKNDTLIGEDKLGYYILKSNTAKRAKKKKLGINHYIVEKNTDFHLPLLLNFETAFEEYKTDNKIPNGIPKILYTTSFLGKKSLIYNLKSFSKINKILFVPKECSYTNP